MAGDVLLPAKNIYFFFFLIFVSDINFVKTFVKTKVNNNESLKYIYDGPAQFIV